MSEQQILEATIRDNSSGRKIAHILVNGYNIVAGNPFGPSRVIRSFKIVDGDLRSHWQTHTPMLLCVKNGQALPVKVAALPSDDESYGLIEFIL